MYVILGGTGKTGGRLAEILLSKGKKVKVIGRNPDRLKILKEKGAEIESGELNDSFFLSKTFRGAEAIYAMVPPNLSAENYREYYNDVSSATLNAIINENIKNVVLLSSIGAHMPAGNGIVQGLYDFETKLNTLNDVNCVYLRAGYFMENFYGYIDMIKKMGIYGSDISPDLKFPLVATKDIAEAASKYLLNLNFRGKNIQYVLGPRDISSREQTKIIGKAIGKPDLSYVQFSYEETEKGMMQMGMSLSVARSFVQFARSLNDGLVYDPGIRNMSNTTPTTFEEFAQSFAMAFSRTELHA
jgi:uncharacterized protein YbjT (DUF2867 family)